jgi:hypothetical protein
LAFAPAIIQFNGGEFGLSNPQNARDWSTGGNTVRPTAYNGTGPLRIELSNCAMYRQGTGGGGTVTVGLPLTVVGEAVNGIAALQQTVTAGHVGHTAAAEHPSDTAGHLPGFVQLLARQTTGLAHHASQTLEQ